MGVRFKKNTSYSVACENLYGEIKLNERGNYAFYPDRDVMPLRMEKILDYGNLDIKNLKKINEEIEILIEFMEAKAVADELAKEDNEDIIIEK